MTEERKKQIMDIIAKKGYSFTPDEVFIKSKDGSESLSMAAREALWPVKMKTSNSKGQP